MKPPSRATRAGQKEDRDMIIRAGQRVIQRVKQPLMYGIATCFLCWSSILLLLIAQSVVVDGIASIGRPDFIQRCIIAVNYYFIKFWKEIGVLWIGVVTLVKQKIIGKVYEFKHDEYDDTEPPELEEIDFTSINKEFEYEQQKNKTAKREVASNSKYSNTGRTQPQPQQPQQVQQPQPLQWFTFDPVYGVVPAETLELWRNAAAQKAKSVDATSKRSRNGAQTKTKIKHTNGGSSQAITSDRSPQAHTEKTNEESPFTSDSPVPTCPKRQLPPVRYSIRK
jgi:hypothetical protein